MTESVRFVHAADLHLDAPFSGVDATDPRVRDALVASTLDALEILVNICIEYQVDFLVLAGDVYNQSDIFLRTEFAFRAACERLSAAGVQVFMTRGNHDPASGRFSGLTMPEGVHVFSEHTVERVPYVRDGHEVCAIYGRSFRQSAETANLAREFSRDVSDTLAIGVLHANVGGRPGHEPYAPCSLDDLRAARMDYWALGHIHKPEVLFEHPLIVYSGCTQGLDPSETGMRGCSVVTLGPDGASVEFVPTARVLWASAVMPIDDCAGLDDVRDLCVAAIEGAHRDAAGLPVIVRIELTGRGGVHDALRWPSVLTDLLADVRGSGLGYEPWVWVDRIADHTRPAVDLATLREGGDFTADLIHLTDAISEDEDELLSFFETVTRPAFSALDRADMPAVDPAEFLRRSRDLALDRLLTEEEQ